MIIEQITVGTMQVCCYIVACNETKEAAIIDPGGDEKKILSRCKEMGLNIKYIIATHGHPDHVCGNGFLQEETGAAIVMHKQDAIFFWQPEVRDYFSMLGLPESPKPDKVVEDGDIITLGNEKLQVLHTPGHTPGGICIYSAPNCFTGDTLFAGGVGRTDFPGGSSQELLDSIRNRLLKLPDDTIVWPGHGYGGTKSTIGAEASSNPFLHGSFL